MYLIAIKKSYPQKTAQVSGIRFSKIAQEIADNRVNREIMNSSILEVIRVEPDEPITPKATQKKTRKKKNVTTT